MGILTTRNIGDYVFDNVVNLLSYIEKMKLDKSQGMQPVLSRYKMIYRSILTINISI